MMMQRVIKSCRTTFDLAFLYYQTLFRIGGVNIGEKAVRLVAYAAVNGGGVINAAVRSGFCQDHNSTMSSVNNMVSSLRKAGIVVDQNGQIRIIRQLSNLDFSKGVVLLIELNLMSYEVTGHQEQANS